MFKNLLAKLRCLRGHHAPDRNRVRHDGLYYTGTCLTCGVPIRKTNGNRWQPYNR